MDGYDEKTLRFLRSAIHWTEVTDSLGHTTRYERLPSGQVVTEVDALGGMRHVAYDEHGRIALRRDQLGHAERYDYDKQGNLCKLTDPTGACEYVDVQPRTLADDADERFATHLEQALRSVESRYCD